MFEESTILITGGTGSFGRAFLADLLKNDNARKIIVFSRDEMKQWKLAQAYDSAANLRFIIGDVRDRERLYRALSGVDFVLHAAATKIVPTAEYNPFEAVKTNVLGAMNLVDAAIDNGVRKVVALSTDKASSPVNMYGATKLVSDKIFSAGSSYAGTGGTKFFVVRYGNVMGSRGSVIPFFLSLKRSGLPLKITDPQMTRFMISLDEAVALVRLAFREGHGGELFVKKIPSMGIMDIADAIAPGESREFVGIRPGEKLHEQMVGIEDAPFTLDFGDHFRIYPVGEGNREQLGNANAGGHTVPNDFSYTSSENNEWMSVRELQTWIRKNENSFLGI